MLLAASSSRRTSRRDLISSEVRPGKVKYEFRPYLIIGPDSKPAMRAALAAGEQNRFWQFLQLFYLNQGRRELRLRHGRLPDEHRQGRRRSRHRQVEHGPQQLQVGRDDPAGQLPGRLVRFHRHAIDRRAGPERPEGDRRKLDPDPPADPGGDPTGQLGLPWCHGLQPGRQPSPAGDHRGRLRLLAVLQPGDPGGDRDGRPSTASARWSSASIARRSRCSRPGWRSASTSSSRAAGDPAAVRRPAPLRAPPSGR